MLLEKIIIFYLYNSFNLPYLEGGLIYILNVFFLNIKGFINSFNLLKPSF